MREDLKPVHDSSMSTSPITKFFFNEYSNGNTDPITLRVPVNMRIRQTKQHSRKLEALTMIVFGQPMDIPPSILAESIKNKPIHILGLKRYEVDATWEFDKGRRAYKLTSVKLL